MIVLYGVIGLSFGSLVTWSNLFLIKFGEWSNAGRFIFLMYLIVVTLSTFSNLQKAANMRNMRNKDKLKRMSDQLI